MFEREKKINIMEAKKIKKGEQYKCLEDWVMESGVIQFTKGKIYVSDFDFHLTNDSERHHTMSLDDEFFEYFEKIETAPAPAKPELTEREKELLLNAQMHIDAIDLSNIEFYDKYGFNVSELIPRTRELIKDSTEI